MTTKDRASGGLGSARVADGSPYAGPMPARTLILASASPARRRLLETAGFRPEIVVSGIDEHDDGTLSTPELARDLAERKVSAVLDRAGTGVVVGCDSILEFDGRRFGKPTDAAEAFTWLTAMRGRTGTLHTGHAVADAAVAGARASATAATDVRFGRPTDAELRAYLATGEALSVAGAFTLDGRSAPFIDGVDGDPGNVIGLSLPFLRTLLARIGIEITELWA